MSLSSENLGLDSAGEGTKTVDRTHLVPDDRIVRSDAVQAREEGEESVNHERNLSSQIDDNFAQHGSLILRARQSLQETTVMEREREREKLTQVTFVGSLMSLSHLFGVAAPPPPPPPFAMNSFRVSGILPSMPIPLVGHDDDPTLASLSCSSPSWSRSRSSSSSCVCGVVRFGLVVPRLLAVELSTTSIATGCRAEDAAGARGAEYSGSPCGLGAYGSSEGEGGEGLRDRDREAEAEAEADEEARTSKGESVVLWLLGLEGRRKVIPQRGASLLLETLAASARCGIVKEIKLRVETHSRSTRHHLHSQLPTRNNSSRRASKHRFEGQ